MLWKKLLNRYNVIALLLMVLAAALLFRLIQIQVVQGEYYADLSENKRIRRIAVEAPRGLFLDRYGREIAGNRPGYVIEIVKTEIVEERLNDVVEGLVDILDKNGERIRVDFPISVDPVEFRFRSQKEEEDWKKMYAVPAGYTARQALETLRERNNIPEYVPDETLVKILSIMHSIKEQGYRSYQPVEIARDVSMETVAQIEERHMDLPGVNVEVKPVRYYRDGSLAAHVLGYLGNINQEELERLKGKGYGQNDIIGKSGLEKVFEEELKGLDGGRQVEVDAVGRFIRSLGEKQSVPGDNIFLTLDAQLQKTAEEAMEQTLEKIRTGQMGQKYPNAAAGAVVAIDVKTGEVLALVSYPAYDPNLFSNGISTEDWVALNPQTTDPTAPRPMYNNAIQAALPPGSTFKMVTGVAGLGEGIITPETIIVDRGVYTAIPGASPACWIWNARGTTHGRENIVDAIKDSCNYFFYEVARLTGIRKLEEYAARFGLGQRTGIELPGEAAGAVAGPSYKATVWKSVIRRYMTDTMGIEDGDTIGAVQSLLDSPPATWTEMRKTLEGIGITRMEHVNRLISHINSGRWMPGQTLSAAIGQGDHIYTPIQMANYVATIANGGTRYRPHLVKKIYDQTTGEYHVVEPQVIDRIGIDPRNLEAIFKGMNAVTAPGGTASSHFRGFPVEVAGKTGTAENPGYDGYAWFVGFAPYDDPQIAVAVVIFQGGSGGYAAPVARAVFEEYLKLNRQEIRIAPGNLLQR